MITLDEHNKHRSDVYEKMQEPHANGIACPSCGDELFDSNPMVVLTSIPPKTNVHCKKCGYHGCRLV